MPVRLGVVTSRVLALEFICIAAAAYLSGTFYRYSALHLPAAPSQYVPAALYIAALVSIITVALRQFANVQRQPLHMLLWNGIGSVALAFSLFLSMLFLLKGTEEYSRGSFLFQIVAVSITVCLTRAIFYFWLQSAIRSGTVAARHVVLIGAEASWREFSDLVRTTAIRSVAYLPFPRHAAASDHTPDDLVDGAAARQAIEACRAANPDDIVILANPEELASAPELARLLSELPVSVHIVPAGTVNFFGMSRIAELGDLKTLEVSRPPLSAFDQTVKRIFDIVVAATGLFLLAPLFAIVAIAIKLESRGKALFWQERQLQPVYRDLGYRAGDFPVAEETCHMRVAADLSRNDGATGAPHGRGRQGVPGRVLLHSSRVIPDEFSEQACAGDGRRRFHRLASRPCAVPLSRLPRHGPGRPVQRQGGKRRDDCASAGFELVQGDARDWPLVAGLVRQADIIFHLACRALRHSIGNPWHSHQVNAAGTLTLLEEMHQAGVKCFIHVSTSKVHHCALCADG